MKKVLGIITFILVAVIAIQEYRISRLQFAGDKVTVVHDTVTVSVPVPVSVVETGQITAKLPVASKNTVLPEKVPEMGGIATVDSLSTTDATDSIEVVVPIETKIYRDSTYRAVISGYRASLDTIQIYSRTTYTEHFAGAGKTMKPRRWSVGVQVGYGTDFRGFRPYVGIGINHSLFGF